MAAHIAGVPLAPFGMVASPRVTYRPHGLTYALTARQQDVAALVAEGLTNRQIAERLVMTERTAETHVCNVMKRLRMHHRGQVAAWVWKRAKVTG